MAQSEPRYVADFPHGAVLRDHLDPESGLRVLVVRGPFSFLGYVGVRADHTLAELEDLHFQCHWGITFNGWGDTDSFREPGWYWWGWDYAHGLDHVDYVASLPPEASDEDKALAARMNQQLENLVAEFFRTPDDRQADEDAATEACGDVQLAIPQLEPLPRKKWTVNEVFEDALDVLMELKAGLEQSQTLSVLLTQRYTKPASH
ncbi:hypothetical protein WL29_21035 [Burkholderia ubonensis]|uniref:Uncharacterized protein n=1 Tax=Burkholderia ubonensis TaxID=101571 RepID=A0A106QCN9_9BURK|nr:hypothetical protein [Burkholderia ubonensis]KWA83853.1 hypothetical protein WL29_21035 [Burkholderia ubonensis]